MHMAAHPTAPPPRAQPALDAVIFDFDGTLVATRSADESAVGALVAADPTAATGVATFWAHDGEPILRRIELAWPGRSAEVLPLFERQGQPRRHPGITRLLRELERRGLAMAVVSSRRRQALDQGLESTRLRPHFRAVVGLDDVREPKPSPEGLRLAMSTLGVTPDRTLYIGDNDLDVEAGHRAGVTVWRAVWGIPRVSPNGVVLLHRPADVVRRLHLPAAPPATGGRAPSP